MSRTFSRVVVGRSLCLLASSLIEWNRRTIIHKLPVPATPVFKNDAAAVLLSMMSTQQLIYSFGKMCVRLATRLTRALSSSQCLSSLRTHTGLINSSLNHCRVIRFSLLAPRSTHTNSAPPILKLFISALSALLFQNSSKFGYSPHQVII